VLKQLEGRGKNIGAGSDIGHWMCANTRPLDGVRLLKGKFTSMHLVDVEAIAANPRSADDYRAGKAAALNFLKGQVMKLSKGKANPNLVGEILAKKLS
jgi:hypothetical protein